MVIKGCMCLVVLLSFLSIHKDIWAQSDIVINEVLVHPSSGDDWIELYNPGSESIVVTGWQIKDAKSSVFTLEGTIDPGSYHIADVSNRLNNTGDIVSLINSDGLVVDTYTYDKDPGVDQSYGRFPNGTGNFSHLQSATKATENTEVGVPSVKPPLSSPPSVATESADRAIEPVGGAQITDTGIVLSEYVPAPATGESEWVEIFNTNSSEANLAGWQIDDGEGGSSPYTLSSDKNILVIPPRSHKVITLSSSRLNNNGDSVRLINPTGTIIETASYTNATTNVAYAKNDSGVWQQTTTPTPNAANIITTPQSSATPQPSAKLTPKTASIASLTGTKNTAAATGSSIDYAATKRTENKKVNAMLPNFSSLVNPMNQPKAIVASDYTQMNAFQSPITRYIMSGIVVSILGGCVIGYKYFQQRRNFEGQVE